MTIDMSQFYQVFFDECAEHLANMESLLLAIDPATASPDDLNAVFRAAHSMKGGAGTFGFTDMTGVTHVLETLLDRVRKNEMALTSEMVDAFLQAGDVIKAQLDAHRAGSELEDREPANEICAKLKQLTEGDQGTHTEPTAPDAAGAPVTEAVTQYEIYFSTDDTSKAVETLLDNLRALGTLDIVTKPQPAETRQEWKLRLATTVADTQILELFDFVKTTAPPEVTVVPTHAVQACEDPGYGFFGAAPSEPQAAADPGYGFFETPTAAAQPVADQGYGFFTDMPAVPVEPAAAVQPPTSATLARNPGRRATDSPDVTAVVAGRRPSDKVAVSPQAEQSSIRVSVEKVDTLINLVGELVITQAMLAQNVLNLDPVLNEKLLNGMAQFERNTRDLQESVMSIRMMPISFVFSRFPRVVRDLAAKLNKQVELKTEGEATELDKGVIEKLADPLTHLVRNSLDHGVESPEDRVAAGKSAKGTITLRAFHRGGNIIVEVVDDGAGLDRQRLLAKARERGMSVSDSMSDQEVYQLIFEAGFSTAAQVTDVSGRGVGMDVVRRNIREMGGSVEINSTLGVGTKISIRLPLTLAILDGMSIGVGKEVFIVPLTNITESLQPLKEHINSIAGRGSVLQVRGDYLPVVALHEIFNLQPSVTEFHKGIMVILESEGAKAALFVDELLGQHQVVIKSLETNYRRVPGVSGATIMGDGRVALILDVAGLISAQRPAYAKAA